MATTPPIDLSWLEDTPDRINGVTWGMPWAAGEVAAVEQLELWAGEVSVPVDSWVTARWPDGSVKWSGHATGAQSDPGPGYQLRVTDLESAHRTASGRGPSVSAVTADTSIVIDTGAVTCVVNRQGRDLVTALVRDGRTVAAHGHLVSLLQSTADDDALDVHRTRFASTVRSAVVESSGRQRVVVRIDGAHRAEEGVDGQPVREWLPFVVRLYFYAGASSIKVMHTMVWDGDEQQDFLAGLGLRFEVPLPDAPHDRHVRIAGEAGHFMSEAVRGLTGLRRDPGADVRQAQIAGEPTPDPSTWNPEVSERLPLIPTWGDYSLSQLSSDGFTLRKRTKAGHGWVGISSGTRSSGFSYVGGVSGGLGLGLRDFWQSFPTQLDIRYADTETAQTTVWLHSPEAPAMDLRFYHDGMGQETYAAQLEGLEITYEDYEPGFGTPYGVARTSELTICAYEATPTSESLAVDAALSQLPPLLRTTPARLSEVGVFGDWSLVDRSTPRRSALEDHLDFLFDYYADQREQRRWYGFWNYGDVMHAYDRDRHVWRYDVGGFAWDNSELSPDLWLWYSYLRSGRADIFRFAEAMTRHTGEVDVYHLGQWQGLGSRHNVQHWGCSAKQVRISNPAYRRIYYYLTADERVGDLLTELVGSDRTFLGLDPNRKVRTDVYAPDPQALAIGLGTDYGALLATWLTEWERTGSEVARGRLLGTMSDVGKLAHGFLTGEALYDISTGRFDIERVRLQVSHLSAVFGLVEICSELIELLDSAELSAPGFRDAWLQYCRLFLATPEQQEAEVGRPLSGIYLTQAHSRLTAYAAHHTGDAELAETAWTAYDTGGEWMTRTSAFQTRLVTGPGVLRPVQESETVTTNDAAQFGLATIQNLALIGDALEKHGQPAARR
jgi:hypothetical protein